jgi:2-C-methyl-D-erythritol 2,4-cyclodiphosphate synthase
MTAPNVRIGEGWDIHALVPDRPLVLGGVTIPHEKGLEGHSDADVLTHATIDALLGATADGDIGTHFPDHDSAWRGASSLDLLRRTLARVHDAGWRVVNLDATVVAERPKLAPHRGAMCETIARALGIDAAAVSVKAKTAEGLGAEGRGEAISAQAVVLLARG